MWNVLCFLYIKCYYCVIKIKESIIFITVFTRRSEAEAVVRGGFHRFQKPRGEETPCGPAGGHTGSLKSVGQEVDSLPGRHFTGRKGHLGA